MGLSTIHIYMISNHYRLSSTCSCSALLFLYQNLISNTYTYVMKKDFDIWNIQKQKIHNHKMRKNYHAGDIWWVRMGVNIGFEQDGKHENFERPCLIIKGFNKEVCLIVPLTTKIKNNKFHSFVGKFARIDNYAILSQIKLIDTKRLVNQIGFIEYNLLSKIKKAIWDLIR